MIGTSAQPASAKDLPMGKVSAHFSSSFLLGVLGALATLARFFSSVVQPDTST
jgi:hypothetical protein